MAFCCYNLFVVGLLERGISIVLFCCVFPKKVPSYGNIDRFVRLNDEKFIFRELFGNASS